MFTRSHFYSVLLMFVCLSLLTGCWPFGTASKKSTTPELMVINVLDKSDFDDCHIKGSVNITFDEFEAKIASLPKQNHYVLYCADYMCMSSGFCAKLLKNAGFENVWAYEGGMTEWYQKNYPYQGAAQLDYLKGENINLAEDEESEVPTLTAEQLLEKMKEFKIVA